MLEWRSQSSWSLLILAPDHPTDRPFPEPHPAPPPVLPRREPRLGPPSPLGPFYSDTASEPDPWIEPPPQPAPKRAWPDPIAPPCPTPTPEYGRKVLTVGDGNFSYSISLHTVHPDWEIIGTNHGNGGNSQNFLGSDGNLTLYTNVDATRLESGRVTGNSRYDAIVFNAPRATGVPVWRKGSSGDLVDAVLRSARHVLKPGRQMRFSRSGGMSATPRLQQRVRPGKWPPRYSNAYGGPYHGGHLYFVDSEGVGVPYQPITNAGEPMDVKWDKTYWYVSFR